MPVPKYPQLVFTCLHLSSPIPVYFLTFYPRYTTSSHFQANQTEWKNHFFISQSSLWDQVSFFFHTFQEIASTGVRIQDLSRSKKCVLQYSNHLFSSLSHCSFVFIQGYQKYKKSGSKLSFLLYYIYISVSTK